MKNNGFTLIELLVVIAIIGLLASIVMSSLLIGKKKSGDATIIREVLELRSLLESNFNDYGSYTYLQPQTSFSSQADCMNYLSSGTYSSAAQQACLAIYKLNWGSTNNFYDPTHFLFMGNNVSTSKNYSIMTFLPGKGTFYCAGSSGRTSDNTLTAAWTNPGCYNNP